MQFTESLPGDINFVSQGVAVREPLCHIQTYPSRPAKQTRGNPATNRDGEET
jgi:hypothetical protein